MDSDYIQLARQVLQTNSQEANQHFQSLVLDCSQIQKLLLISKQSNQVLFVTCELLAKAILKQKFLAFDESRSEDGDSQKNNQLEKIRILSNIMIRLYSIVTGSFLRQPYLIKSCVNLISLCLKSVFEKSILVKLTNQALQEYLGIFLPGFQINQNFSNNFNNQLVIIQPTNVIPEGYSIAMSIFHCLMDYITISAYYKTYYDFRRNIYTFRNSHLPILLNICIQYIVSLLDVCQKVNWQLNNFMLHNISQTLTLLDSIFMYPFTLSLHQYDHELQPNDNITGLNGQIYFPQYFRNVLCHEIFKDQIMKYYTIINMSTNINYKQDIKRLIRIIGRMASSSSYCFNTDQQKRVFRNQAVTMAIILVQQCKFEDSYILNSISDILIKILSSYISTDYGNKMFQFLHACVFFAKIMINSRIILTEGKKNPLAIGLQLLALTVGQSIQTLQQSNIKQTAQCLVERVFQRLCDGNQTTQILKQFGNNNNISQIELFEQLFQNFPHIFQYFRQINLLFLKNLKLNDFTTSSKIFWLHLTALLLPNNQAKLQETQLILKFFELAKQQSNIASLHYIRVLLQQIMFDMDQTQPTTSLWKSIVEITNETFSSLINFTLKKCYSNFTIPDNAILDYSLEVFKIIYTKLKKYDKPQFQTFYALVTEMLKNINSTIFADPKFFKKRVTFFNVISIIWLNSQDYHYIYQVYNLILKQLKEQNSLIAFLKFINDVTGLLQPIELYEPFQILAQLVIKDLAEFLPIVLNPKQLPVAFGQSKFLKAFLRLVLSLVTDTYRRLTNDTQCQLPLKIHQLFYPYLKEVIKYQYPRITIIVWSKFISLHPLGQVLPIEQNMQSLDPVNYTIMIRQYFQNIYRLTNLEQLYPYIQDNVEYMSQWWQEVISRELLPKMNFKQIVQARIWNTKRQKQIFGKMLYTIGRYNTNYWNIPQNISERIFVSDFVQNYN